ncbi:MAG TPA: metallopeptidase TldD-related protein [Candidatus Acidoferrales bacterium]|nr:metallopeptidase TldD-related protein [Candidatus Acidoferrales bacterium]
MNTNDKRKATPSILSPLLVVFLALCCSNPASAQKSVKTAASRASGAPASAVSAAPADASSDPVISAMREELDRSKSHVKMDNVSAPYYIEYRLSDVQEYTAEAAFGALRQNQRVHVRSVRVVVRVGDYKQDSYYGPGVGVVDLAPLDNDSIALRRQLWNATDRAYKMASEALAAKKALLSQYSTEQPFDDFAKVPALQSIGPLAKLEFSADEWKQALEKSTELFRSDPKIQSLSAGVRFRAVNFYLVNTEGTITRQGYAAYSVQLAGETQAADGMQLARSPFYMASTAAELPQPEKLQSDMTKMLETLKDLREAPLVEEDYRGPVLFSNDAASDVFSGMVGYNLLGIRPKPGESARTVGEFSSSYKSRVLPDFLSVVDDPTMKTFQGKSLIGNYEIDEEGVRAESVPLIKDGVLVDYLLGRMPIRDFPDSNGHGRAAPGQPPMPSIGNLFVRPKQAVPAEELKKKLIEMCKQANKPYGYYVETLSGYDPRLLYRVYANDGHEELVRGAVFNELDVRTLRNDLVAAGDDPLVSNREGAIPTTVICPSVLFDELEVKRTDRKNAKLPEYPPPDLTFTH